MNITEGTRVQTKSGVIAIAKAAPYIARNGKEMVELRREGDSSNRWFRAQVSTLKEA